MGHSISNPFQGLVAVAGFVIFCLFALGRLEVWMVAIALVLGLWAASGGGISWRLPRFAVIGGPSGNVAAPTLSKGMRVLAGLSLAMSLTTLLMTLSRRNDAGYLDTFVLWVAAIGLMIAASIKEDGVPYSIELSRRELAFTALLFLCSLAVRSVGLGELPRNFGGDEGSMALPGREILQGKPINPFGTGWFSVPNLFSYVQAATMALLGDTVLGARWQAALVGALSVLATYFLGRRVAGRERGAVAAFLLALNHMHLFFSRLSSNMIEDTLLGPLTLLLLLQGLSSRKWLPFTASGVLLGFTQYFYFGGRLLPAIVVLVLLYAVITSKGQVVRQLWPHLGMMLLGFVVAFAPLAGYYLQHPGEYVARINQVSVFQSGWLAREIALTGRPGWEILLDQWRKTFLVFFTELPKGWYSIGQPLMDPFNAALLLIGFFSVLMKVKRTEQYSVLVAFLAVVVGVGLTEGAPTSQRMVLILPFAALLQAHGLRTVMGLVEGVGAARLASPAVAVGFLLVGYLNMDTFLNVSLTYEYGYTNTTVATELAYYLKSRSDKPTVFFYGPPRMWYYGFSTLPFIAPNAKGVDVEKGASALPGALEAPPPRLFVFLPERRQELDAVTLALPGGRLMEFRKANGELLFLLYDADVGGISGESGRWEERL